MQIEMTPIAQLVPYAGNARTHSESQVAQIAASILEFGFTNPILVGSDSVIIAGHGRLMAAQQLGVEKVPVIALFILGARRSGEKAGRAAERLQNFERTNDARQRMLEAGADRPRDRDDLVERLRKGEF